MTKSRWYFPATQFSARRCLLNPDASSRNISYFDNLKSTSPQRLVSDRVPLTSLSHLHCRTAHRTTSSIHHQCSLQIIFPGPLRGADRPPSNGHNLDIIVASGAQLLWAFRAWYDEIIRFMNVDPAQCYRPCQSKKQHSIQGIKSSAVIVVWHVQSLPRLQCRTYAVFASTPHERLMLFGSTRRNLIHHVQRLE